MKYGAFLLLLLGLIMIYKIYDPSMFTFFPKCPFFSFTGFLCPGCGSQRAIHHLLNLQFSAAFQQNSLMIVSIPYLLLGFTFDRIPAPTKKMLKWRKVFFGQRTILVVLLVVILFWLLRNL